MAGSETKMTDEEQQRAMVQRKHLVCHVSSRILACAAMAVAAIVAAFNRETSVFGNVAMQADYKTISTFKFFIGGNAVASAYCLLSLPVVVAHQGKVLVVHVLDLLMMGLAVAAVAAATAVGFVAKYGEVNAGWMAVCGYFPNFCNRAEVAVAMSFLGVVGCLLFCVMQPLPKPTRRGGGVVSAAHP